MFHRESQSVIGALHRGFIGCDVASAHRRRSRLPANAVHTVLRGDEYCMSYPMDAHRPNAVASLSEHATHEGTDSHGSAVTPCSNRSSDLPAPEHDWTAMPCWLHCVQAPAAPQAPAQTLFEWCARCTRGMSPSCACFRRRSCAAWHTMRPHPVLAYKRLVECSRSRS